MKAMALSVVEMENEAAAAEFNSKNTKENFLNILNLLKEKGSLSCEKIHKLLGWNDKTEDYIERMYLTTNVYPGFLITFKASNGERKYDLPATIGDVERLCHYYGFDYDVVNQTYSLTKDKKERKFTILYEVLQLLFDNYGIKYDSGMISKKIGVPFNITSATLSTLYKTGMIIREGTHRRYSYQINPDDKMADKILNALGLNVERSIGLSAMHADKNSGKKDAKMVSPTTEIVQKYSNTKSGSPMITPVEKFPTQLALVSNNTPSEDVPSKPVPQPQPEETPSVPRKEEPTETPPVKEPESETSSKKTPDIVRRAVVRPPKPKTEVAFSLLETTLIERIMVHPTPIYLDELENGLRATKYAFVQAVDRLIKLKLVEIEEMNECQFFSINKKVYATYKDAILGAGARLDITKEEKIAFLSGIKSGFTLNAQQQSVLLAIVADVKMK
jgi:predicted transcriptional regulator